LSQNDDFFRVSPHSQAKTVRVFGRGLLDSLDDDFWILPFSSKKLSQILAIASASESDPR
jgi:hypothetical protein